MSGSTYVAGSASGTARPRRGVSIGAVGIRVTRRAVLATVAVLLLVVVLVVVSVFTGTLDLPADRVWAALTGQGTRIENLVVIDRRLARALAAVLVGLALGAAGALTQSITRNPIASPDILGVTAGASLFAVFLATRPEVVEQAGLGRANTLLVPGALIGGLLTTTAILALSWRAGFDGLRLILVGLSVSAIALSGVSWLLTRAETVEAQVATRWLVGSLGGARMGDVWLLLPPTVLGLLACVVLSRSLAALRLGRQVAPSLGVTAARVEGAGVLIAVVLVSIATAVVGPIGFVAFVAPQAAMRLFGTAGPPPVAGALFGAGLVLAADLVAQRLPVELPVGILTAVIGAPYLLHLLIQHVRREGV